MTEAAASLVIAPVIVALCFAENFRDSGSALFVCYPAPSPPSNSNFLHPRSQFESRLLSPSFLSDLSLFFALSLFVALSFR